MKFLLLIAALFVFVNCATNSNRDVANEPDQAEKVYKNKKSYTPIY